MTITARVPPRVEQALGEYCVQRGLTKSEVIVNALEAYLCPNEIEESSYVLAENAGFIGCVDVDVSNAVAPLSGHKARVKAAILAKHHRA